MRLMRGSECGQDIDEAALADRVRELLGKYAKDRKRRIMIEWAEDKILEERLFRQLNGETPVRPRSLCSDAYDIWHAVPCACTLCACAWQWHPCADSQC
jgi:hypothetical protein